jgi:hypothetical protein
VPVKAMASSKKVAAAGATPARSAGNHGQKVNPKPPVKGKARPRTSYRRDFMLTAALFGIVFGLLGAFAYGLWMPKSPWAFDRPDAQLPSLQSRHTLQ